MRVVSLHDKAEIESALRREVYLQLYGLGDLDDAFWPWTTWYTLAGPRPGPIALLYFGLTLPTLLALTGGSLDSMARLLRSIVHLLPRRCYAHLSGRTAEVFENDYRVESHGTYLKMGLTDASALEAAGVDTSEVTPLGHGDIPDIGKLYAASYPGHWFEPAMLDAGLYFGVRRGSRLVSISGTHVYSRRYRVAALGNVATHPDFRGQGLCQAVTAKLCSTLVGDVDHIGLNVKADNASGIACYQKLGFERIASYQECMLEAK